MKKSVLALAVTVFTAGAAFYTTDQSSTVVSQPAEVAQATPAVIDSGTAEPAFEATQVRITQAPVAEEIRNQTASTPTVDSAVVDDQVIASSARHAMFRSEGSVSSIGPAAPSAPLPGTTDRIVSLEEGVSIEDFREVIGELDGEVLRVFSSINAVAVRIPEAHVGRIDDIDGVGNSVEDAPIEFMSQASRDAARLPTAGMPEFVNVDPSIGVAVVDTGVGNHNDINLASRVALSAPDALSTTTLRHDEGLKSLYLFDEGRGSRIYDRGSNPAHLDHYADASGLTHPDALSLSSLYAESSSQV